MKDTEYMKSTGKCRYMTKFVSDMTRFYEQIELNEIASLGRIQRTLLSGERYDFSLTCQIGFFLNMTPEELTAPQLSEKHIQQEEKSHYIKGNIVPDWKQYDTDTALIMEQVAADIYSGAADSMGKPEKVTEKFICRILGIKQHQLENMPKCRDVLEKYSESYPEAWARKLVWAYDWLENNEEDTFYWKHLRKLTGVKKERFDEIVPYLKKYANEDEVKLIVATVKGICSNAAVSSFDRANVTLKNSSTSSGYFSITSFGLNIISPSNLKIYLLGLYHISTVLYI